MIAVKNETIYIHSVNVHEWAEQSLMSALILWGGDQSRRSKTEVVQVLVVPMLLSITSLSAHQLASYLAIVTTYHYTLFPNQVDCVVKMSSVP